MCDCLQKESFEGCLVLVSDVSALSLCREIMCDLAWFESHGACEHAHSLIL